MKIRQYELPETYNRCVINSEMDVRAICNYICATEILAYSFSSEFEERMVKDYNKNQNKISHLLWYNKDYELMVHFVPRDSELALD